MPPTANTFVKYTNDEDIDAPHSLVTRTRFLAAADVSSANLSNKEITKRCAALAWARHHLKEGEDPKETASNLSDKMRQTLLSLYVLPPHRGDSPPPSDAQRLASMIRLCYPENEEVEGENDDPPSLPRSECINTDRPGDQGTGSVNTGAGGAAQFQPNTGGSGGAPAIPTPHAPPPST
jgi:hypothetical protein